MIPPFRPRAVVGLNVQSYSFAYQVGKARAVMTLAVRDDFLINRQPFCSQVLFGVRTNTQPIFVIHQLGPLTMDGARNVARLRSRRPSAAIFGRAACVPNSEVGVA